MRNFLVALVVFIIVVGGLGTMVVRFANRNDKPATPPGQTNKPTKFADNATRVRFITDGAIVGLENHRGIRITIDKNERKLEILKGYNDEVISEEKFANDAAAFSKFLIAIDSFGYTRENTEFPKDERGVCPLGTRYIYEAVYKSGQPLRSWSSSCGKGRLLGKSQSIQQLFRNQIPDYNKITSGVRLSGQ